MKKDKKQTDTVLKAVTAEKGKVHSSLKRWLMIVTGIFAFLLYANTLQHDFVLDDETVIGKNKFTKEGITAMPEIFTTAYRAGFWDREEGLYRPLSTALFAVEWQIAPANPHFFHWVNVILYAITASVLLSILLYFFEKTNIVIPLIATLLFIAHPIHTEVVANIKSCDEILCFLFSMISLWAAVKYARTNQLWLLSLAGVTQLLALLSKETAVTMVAVAPLAVYFFSPASSRKIIISSLPFVAALLIYLGVRVAVLNGLTGFNEILLINNSLAAAGDDTLTRLTTALYIIGRYMLLLVMPVPLCFDYSYNTIPLFSLAAPEVWLTVAVIIGCIVFAVRGWKSKKPVAFSIFFFAATLSLTSNILFLIEATLAERFLYMPALGFCIGIAFLLAQICNTDMAAMAYRNIRALAGSNKGIISIAVIILVLYAVKTVARNNDWKDNITLTKTDVQTHPNSARIRYAYGSILVMEKGLTEKNAGIKQQFLTEGVRQLTEAVKILPDYGEAWFNLGMGYKELEDYKKAVQCFETAGDNMTKKDQHFYVAAGVAYGENKQYQQSFEMFSKAIELDSTSSDPYNNMGLFFSRMHNFPQSIAMLNKAMELNPKDEFPPYNMGNTYAEMGDYKTAIEYYNKAVTINPEADIVWVNLGNSYGALKDFPNALKAFAKALSVNPENQNARYNIGATYYYMGDTLNAKKYLPAR
ncbi:MAG: tetratricopeptide repeat protein [Chitinophagales bacterium]|nr:tetratricopeptide repeat protein [Chitinophagales bacterium]